jgi:hypothetical protein
MRRIAIAATILAAACGGKNTIPATPEIKASVTQAELGMSSSSSNTQATIGLQSVGASVADAASTGDVSTVDMTGLSDPASLSAAAVRAAPSTVQQSLRSPSAGGTQASTSPVGCIQRNPSTSTPELIPAGTGGCTAADHLEIIYDNGDKVNVTWTGSDTSFDLRIVVVEGPWTGTNLHYQGQGNISSVTVHVDGAMKYSKSGSVVHVDADFNATYQLSGTQTASGFSATMSVNGTATDHIALVRAHQGWSLTVQTSTSGQTEHVTLDWNGSIGIDLLQADGVTTDHAVAFNLNVHVTSDSAPGSVTVTYSAGGDVDWDGAIVGNVVAKNDQLYVEWTDGTESSFDPSALIGSQGV